MGSSPTPVGQHPLSIHRSSKTTRMAWPQMVRFATSPAPHPEAQTVAAQAGSSMQLRSPSTTASTPALRPWCSRRRRPMQPSGARSTVRYRRRRMAQLSPPGPRSPWLTPPPFERWPIAMVGFQVRLKPAATCLPQTSLLRGGRRDGQPVRRMVRCWTTGWTPMSSPATKPQYKQHSLVFRPCRS
jgi:hypothetical protein